MKTIYQVAYRNMDGNAIHETEDANEAMVFFKDFFDALVNGGGWNPIIFNNPQMDGDVIVSEGNSLLVRENKRFGKCATTLHLHIIRK